MYAFLRILFFVLVDMIIVMYLFLIVTPLSLLVMEPGFRLGFSWALEYLWARRLWLKPVRLFRVRLLATPLFQAFRLDSAANVGMFSRPNIWVDQL
jgi:hypothetical protein